MRRSDERSMVISDVTGRFEKTNRKQRLIASIAKQLKRLQLKTCRKTRNIFQRFNQISNAYTHPLYSTFDSFICTQGSISPRRQRTTTTHQQQQQYCLIYAPRTQVRRECSTPGGRVDIWRVLSDPGHQENGSMTCWLERREG